VTTVYVSIGNSDNKLDQYDWSQFLTEVDRAVSNLAQLQGVTVHGRWYSLPTEPWQNACWCFQADDACTQQVTDLREWLAFLAKQFRQDSIAWAVAETEFIGPES
jgi:hypothetical protein